MKSDAQAAFLRQNRSTIGHMWCPHCLGQVVHFYAEDRPQRRPYLCIHCDKRLKAEEPLAEPRQGSVSYLDMSRAMFDHQFDPMTLTDVLEELCDKYPTVFSGAMGGRSLGRTSCLDSPSEEEGPPESTSDNPTGTTPTPAPTSGTGTTSGRVTA